MRHWGLCCMLAGSLAGLAGCGWQGFSAKAPQGGLAVVDLDRVATAVGVKTRLDEMVQFRQAALDNEFGKYSKDQNEKLKGLLEEVKEKFPEEVPAEEVKKLRVEAATAQKNVQQFRTSAQLNLNKYTEELKVQFREVVRPVAQEIALKKGFSVVIPKNDGLLLSVEPGNDITNEVILAMQANGTKAGAVEAVGKDAAKSDKKKTSEKKTAAAPKETVPPSGGEEK